MQISFACRIAPTDRIETELCSDWRDWSRAVGVESRGGSYVVEYLFYILFSVSLRPKMAESHSRSQILFATCASILVKNFAPYARHSGIPEIKTVLGGFVIRRFLGTWTLVIKSIGLVRL